MTNEIKEKQLKEVLYGLDYIGNKIKNDDGILELGVNNCKLLLDYITNLQQRIDKAVEYINTFSITVNVPVYRQILDINPQELLNILRGEDNESD